jgi:YtoQ family protein
MLPLTVYLCGEIHTDWREEIQRGITEHDLPVTILTPVVTHEASDDVGANILGAEEKPFWYDHTSAKISSVRIKTAIEKADVVVVKFGDKYRQWNAAFEAGYASALGKHLITLHSPDIRHPLKEIDASAVATTETPGQVVEILKYITTQK